MSHYFFIWGAYGATFCGLFLLALSTFLEKKRLEKTYKKLEAKQRGPLGQ